jgi:hypothetical protein
MHQELKPIEDVREGEQGLIASPFLAVCELKGDPRFHRIAGLDKWLDFYTREAAAQSRWKARERGLEKLCEHVEMCDLVLVSDKSWPPLNPAMREVNGTWEVNGNLWNGQAHWRLKSMVQVLHRERLWREQQQANAPRTPARREEYMPLDGPGNRPMTLGPHVGSDSVNGYGNKPATIESQDSNSQKMEPPKDLPSSYAGKLYGKEVILPNVQTKTIRYEKRDRADYRNLRKEFDGKQRSEFLKNVGSDSEKIKQLESAGLTKGDITQIKKGIAPPEWQVHHKIPLDDGGTNKFDNLILIKNDPAHKVLTNAQFELTRGMKEGAVRIVKFPIPDGIVYPIKPGHIT